MDSTQRISESLLESEEEDNEEETQNKRGKPLAKLFILKNEHIPETELPLFLGDNVLGRDPSSCTLVLSSPSVSKQHANICISRYRRRGSRGEVDMEALVWDNGSMNGTRKGHLKLTPNVRYALNEGDSLVLADIPCQYISCRVDAACFQGQSRTSVSRQSGVQAGMPDPSREDESGSSNTTCAEAGTNILASLSSPDQEDIKKTLARRSCLTFEQTPTHPEGTLVPESDSDSDGERERTRSGGQITAVSDADSLICSRACPANTKTIIPESEDESSIIHSCTKNRPGQNVSVCKDQADIDAMQQQNEQGFFVGGKEEEEERKVEERAASGGREAEESGCDVPAKQSVHVSLTGEDEVPVSAPAVPMDLMPVFNMDSDTDVEGEGGVVSAGSGAINANQVNTVHFHMESDTDAEEEEEDDSLDKVPKSVPSCDDGTISPHAPPLIPLPDIALDSDTDVDDDANTAGSVAATKTSPASLQSAADGVPLTRLKDFHLDSDTDAEDEKEESGINKTGLKMVDIPNKSDLKPSEFESTPAVPQSLDSDTDDEVNPAISQCPAVTTAAESCITAAAGADLEILSNSDTDLEDDAPCLQNVAVKACSVTPVAALTSLHSDSDADTDVNESNGPSAGGVTDLGLGHGAHLEDKQCDEGHISHPEQTSGLPVPELQMCSTPHQFSGELAEMETQAFLSPSLEPLKCTPAPSVRPASCSGNQDDDFVAETQSFIVESQDCPASPPDEPTQAFGLNSSEDENHDQSSRGGSFQLGLSDSSHLQCQAQALAMESTQAYVDGSLSLEETQAYGGGEEPSKYSANFERDDWEELALQATQAYIPELQSLPEDESKEDEIKNIATAETQLIEFPTASDFAVAETQPMFALEEERDGTKDRLLSSVQHVATKNHNETKDGQEHGDAAKNLDGPVSQSVFIAETQPMVATEDEESDDDESFPLKQKRKAKPLPLEEEATQSFTNSEVSAVDTHPTHGSDVKIQPTEDGRESFPLPLEGEETQTYTNSELSAVDTQLTHDDKVKTQSAADDEDSFPGVQKRKARPLPPEEECTQVSAADTQPMHIDGDETHHMSANEKEESDDENSIPQLRKRKARPLPPEEEDTQVSVADTQPMHIDDDDETQAVHALEKKETKSIPGSCKRKEKPQELEEEETQPLQSCDLFVADTQPIQHSDDEAQHVAMCDDGKTDNEDSNLGRLKRKAKTQTSKEVTQVSAAETQPIHAYDDDETQPVETNLEIQKTRTQPKRGSENPSEAGTSGIDIKSKKGTRATTKEDEEDEDSEPPKKPTRGKGKALPFTRVSRGKFKPDAIKEKEEQIKHARTTSPRQQKDEEKERLEMEGEKMAENDNLLKERDGIPRTGKEVEKRHSLQLRQQEKGRRDVDKREQDEFESQKQDKSGSNKQEKQQRLQSQLETVRLGREKAEKEENVERKEDDDKIKARRMQCEKNQLKCAKLEKQSAELKEQEKLHQEREKQKPNTRMESELKVREERERLEREGTEKLMKGQQENKELSTRGRRGGRTSTAPPCRPEQKQDSDDDFPARRTRSRSSSCNSVNSERSASSANTPVSRGRGRGRRTSRTSQQANVTITRKDSKQRTVAEDLFARRQTTAQDSNSPSPSGHLLRSTSLKSDVSRCSTSSQNRGKGYRQRGRGRKTEAQSDAATPVRDQNSAPTATLRGRRSKKSEGSSLTSLLHEDNEEANSKRCSTTRGQKRANTNGSESTAANEEDQPTQEGESSSEALLLLRTNNRGRKAVKRDSLATQSLVTTASQEDEAKEARRGRKRDLVEEAETLVSTPKNSRGNVKPQKGKRVLEENDEKEEIPVSVQAKRRGRPAGRSANESSHKVEVKEESDKMEEEMVLRRARGRLSVLHNKEKQEPEDSSSMEQDTNLEASERSQTPRRSVSRKQRESVDSSPLAKIPRSSSATPASRLRAASPVCRFCVLFTGVVDEAWEEAVVRLGGIIAKDVADMNYLVTDRVRRTVKFLCAVAKGVPIVTPQWLEKSDKAESFLSPNAFIVKDLEQEKKFDFCLKESLRIASRQPLLQGYEIHVTKSVKPEPVHMKDIISCSGATFLPKMPSSHKPQSVVISCEEDWPLCAPAVSASLPVVTAEFILTGILQQKLDFQTHTLSAPPANPQPVVGRGRARKKP